MQTVRYRADQEVAIIEVELISASKTIIISAYDKDSLNSLMFEDQFQFSSIIQNSDIFLGEWSRFCKLIKYTFELNHSKINLDSNGQLKISYQISAIGQTINKSISFKLKRKMQYQDEVRILRQKVNTYEQRFADFKKQINILKEENKEISARISVLEQLSNNKKEQSRTSKTRQKPLSTEQLKYQEIPLRETFDNQTFEQINILTADIDPKSLYYGNFIIEGQKIRSILQDYYQVHWKNPLPTKGIVNATFKMCAKNHYSIGILAQSQLKNQYSFQNKKSVCLYTYFDGSFRGLYVRGQYIPLQWAIELNQLVQIEINMTKGEFSVEIKSQKQSRVIDIKQLKNSDKLYFFLQMYQKDNALQFLNR